jgi:hypothetical protein
MLNVFEPAFVRARRTRRLQRVFPCAVQVHALGWGNLLTARGILRVLSGCAKGDCSCEQTETTKAKHAAPFPHISEAIFELRNFFRSSVLCQKLVNFCA